MPEIDIPSVTHYRVDIERDGAWWDITGYVIRYAMPIFGAPTLYVREVLPVPLPARLRFSWQQMIPAATWDDPIWARFAAARGIRPDTLLDAEVIGEVHTITVEPPPLFDQTRPARLSLTVIEGDPHAG